MGALAAAGADTWATEIGAFSPTPPRNILTGKLVPHGRSGGITALGTLGGIAGAAVIAGLAGLVAPRTSFGAAGTLIAAAAGILGMVTDSAVGATLQEIYSCPVCEAVSERPGACHEPLRLQRGIRGLNNDAVNFVCTGAGAALSLLGWRILAR